MNSDKQIKKIDALMAQLKIIKDSIKKRDRIGARECHTPHQHDKRSTDMTWEAMRKETAQDEAHALAVELGLADIRSDDAYGLDYFQPSPMHRYDRIRRKPEDFERL